MPCKTLAILLSGLTYKKDNGYLYRTIGVSGVVHPQTQLNDASVAFHVGAQSVGAMMGYAAESLVVNTAAQRP